MWDKSSWPERVVVIWGLLIASSAVLYVAVSLSSLIFEKSSDIANWVQAIGSIVAIAATAIIARRDGLHRIRADKDKELNNLRKAKYYLQQTNVLHSLYHFEASWKRYDTLCANGDIEHIGEYKKLYFFRITKRSFFQLLDSIDSMSEERREIILTGDYSEVLLPLFEIVEHYKEMYGSVQKVSAPFPDEIYDDDFVRRLSGYENVWISVLEKKLEAQFEGVMMHKIQFLNKKKELFLISKYGAN